MANTKISQLSSGSPLQLADLIPIARSSSNYSIPLGSVGSSNQPFISVSAVGISGGAPIANNGMAYGPDTAGTTTSGIQEAITAAISTGVNIYLGPGIFNCTSQIVVANTSGLPSVNISGSGMFETYIEYTSATAQDFFVTTASANVSSTFNTWISIREVTFTYNTNNQNYIMNLTQLQGASFINVQFASALTFPPSSAQGVIGLKCSPYNGNQLTFYNCWWQNLAFGVEINADHMLFNNCYFAGCGMYNSGSGNVFATTYTGTPYAVGGAVYINPVTGVRGTVFDTIFQDCHFFLNSCAVLDNGNATTQGFVPLLTGGFSESSNYDVLSVQNGLFMMINCQRNGTNISGSVSSSGVISAGFSNLLRIEYWTGCLNILSGGSGNAISIPNSLNIELSSTGSNIHADGSGNIFFAAASAGVYIRPSQFNNDGALEITSLGALLYNSSGSTGLSINNYGYVTAYTGVNTTGFGVPAIFGSAMNVSLGTGSTGVCSYTPNQSAGQHFVIHWTLSCKTSSTPNLQVTFTDPNAGSQTITLYNTAMTTNQVQQGTYSLVATNSSAVAITGTDSAALGDIYATACITEMQ